MDFKKYIRTVENFPKQGIDFKDITTLLSNPEIFLESIKYMNNLFSDKKIDKILAFDARGFIFGSVMAYEQNIPFVPIRKKGKLPYETISESYGLEYGYDSIEIHIDSINKGDNVLLIDDLLATGGTMKAGCTLVERLGGNVSGCGFLIELSDLKGRDKLINYDVRSLIKY